MNCDGAWNGDRMIFSRATTRYGEKSTDDGANWLLMWRLVYRRGKA